MGHGNGNTRYKYRDFRVPIFIYDAVVAEQKVFVLEVDDDCDDLVHYMAELIHDNSHDRTRHQTVNFLANSMDSIARIVDEVGDTTSD